jgi:hypothetical protein
MSDNIYNITNTDTKTSEQFLFVFWQHIPEKPTPPPPPLVLNN